jgi:hypothetical protein
MTGRTATGAGKGRSARQNWGFTKWSLSHWAKPNNSKQMIIVLTAMNTPQTANTWPGKKLYGNTVGNKT